MSTNYMEVTDIEEGHINGSDLPPDIHKQSVKCTCPKCGITHILKFFWSGKGTPRKYCHRCREVIAGVNDQYIYESIPDVFRVHRGASASNTDG